MEQEQKVVEIFIKKWQNTDTFPCPNCEKKIELENSKYICEECNIRIVPKIKFNFK